MLTDDMKRVALRILKALDVPEAQVISDHIKHRRWDELVNIKFDPLLHSHKSVDEFRRICLAQEFLRKADFLETTIDTAQVARDGFLSSERQCFLANRHLEKFLAPKQSCHRTLCTTDVALVWLDAQMEKHEPCCHSKVCCRYPGLCLLC